jgi:hypothetical protein
MIGRAYYARVIVPCKYCGTKVEASANVVRVCFECKKQKNLENYHLREQKKREANN